MAAIVERLERRDLLAAGPVVSAPTIAPLAGLQFTGVVATFTDANAGSFTDTINWGDGSPTSAGVITANPGGGFNVVGVHTYAAVGSFTTTVTVVSVPDNQQGSASGQAVVTNAVLAVVTPPAIAASTGLPFTGFVTSFTDTNPASLPSDFAATINWGDGASTPGTIAVDPGVGFEVTGTHTYASAGTTPYPVAVSVVRNANGQTVSATGTATVSGATLTATPVPFFPTAGRPFTSLVATLDDTDTSSQPADFTTTIDWGDGSPVSSGILSPTTAGQYQVSGTHTYALAGTETAVITVIRASNGQVANTSDTVTVAAPTTAVISGAGTTITPFVAQPFTGVVASFTTTPPAPPADLVATIDWGDGQSSAGTVVADGSSFDVVGSHTYGTVSGGAAANAPVPVTVRVVEGLSVSSNATATILSQALVQAQPFSGGLNPLSDTGASNHDGITSINQPEFSGSARPYSLIDLDSQTDGQSGPILLGQAAAGADGSWNIFTGPLADGRYAITATVVPPGGSPQATVALPPVTIDTGAPWVSAVSVEPATGNVVVIFRDDRGGMDLAGLANPLNYDLIGPRPYRPSAALHPSQVWVQAVPADPLAAAVTIHPGLPLRRLRQLRLVSAGLADLAGNSIAGGDFVTTLVPSHHSALPRRMTPRSQSR